MRRRLALYLGAMLSCALSPAAAAEYANPGRLEHPTYTTGFTGPSMLGTTAVSIRAARFNTVWAHAMQDATRSPQLLQMVGPARQLGRFEQLAYVQSRVHNSIRWISDTTEWGQHDYWASASETLARGAGDMEDRAMVKLQALRALGFRPGDLFLTLARDRVGGPITVLTARLNGRYYILDDTGGTPFLADSRRAELEPVLSFGWTSAWVHQRRAPPPAIASLQGNAARK